ncbi:MAG: rhomboid family intramembrane serine protease [Chitinophagales bacterium]
MPQDTSTFQYLLYAIIGANLIFSFLGFNNRTLFDSYKFHVGSILDRKQFYRMISSAFLHGDFMHLAFNMYTLYIFAPILQFHITTVEFSILYFACLLIGNILPLYFNRHNKHYSAIGASGAVSGVIYASVLFYPDLQLYLFFAIPIKSWIFGILYLLYTMYSIRQKNDNIGHEAHLGGAVMGLIIAYILAPELVMKNWWVAALLFTPTIIFFLILWKKPEWLNSSSPRTPFKARNIGTARSKRSIDDLYYNAEWEREKELNRLLEKINQNGIESLSANEKQRLKELSK